MAKALFLDRDGVINLDKGYVHKIPDFEFVDGILELVVRFCEAGYLPIMVTNQSGIGRGYYTESDFWTLTQWVREQFLAVGITSFPVYFSPFHPEASVEAYRRDSDCRKPNPGMLLKAQEDWDIELGDSVLIGDSWRDIQAGHRCGVGRLIYFSRNAPMSHSDYPEIRHQLEVVHSLNDVIPIR